ncbi:MAG: lipoyl(octanoyl) transferase [Candidatus Firestonebacteria bacterium RIFOXYC2_FULL_39_67]|nr:MAG: lipoyl(octanoyl) transferase [Candidatus Firestonebacteria bacterium RIFOXYD2_FULL_39_29]OGF52306.1 MAG: lipoyl(octanoyl) transferase [Candidatus Firestonebacteria bacterium RifOxyC12_full_39_7]OGF53298.1 MAG: lipoyl(octanoyl) transferase [Candidatus Firestonebacteria bacterium RIFOXYC2_FULL_39_67]
MEVKRLGLVEYRKAHVYQLELIEKRKKNEISDTLILLEHPSVITLGRSARKENLLNMPSDVPVIEIERGGDITAHFPGQITGYLIFDLKSRGRDVHKFMRDIEQSVIDFLSFYGIKGERRQGFTGVYVKGDKICSIGLGVKSWITFHGFGLNIGTDLSVFDLMVPCGIKNLKMTSVERLLNKKTDRKDIEERIAEAVKKVFG